MKIFTLLVAVIFLTTSIAQPSLEDTVALENYLDGMIEARMHDKHIAGATMSVVSNGRVILKKGYGFANMDKRIKVNPDSTLFRIGSISKLFVWTAIMQLYEQKKIQLDDDINNYFKDFQIPPTFDQPITIRDLMTHTAGFEEYVIGLFSKDSSSIRPLVETLSKEIPSRVRPPGKYASYSNHATGMAAHIVEVVSGLSWEDYVEQYILIPLKLSMTTFRQPVPDNLASQLSLGYAYKGGKFEEQDFEFIPLGAVGAAGTTASDMARFMLMHLQSGSLDGVSVLDSSTSTLMQSPAFQHHERTNQMRYGFMDFSQNGETIIGHGGNTFWFHSLMAVWPERNFGLFISFNSQSGGSILSDVLENLVDRYFPESLQKSIPVPGSTLEEFVGEYAINRRPESRFTKVARIMGILKVSVADSLLRLQRGEEITYWSQLDETTFQNIQSSEVIAFQFDEKDRVNHMFIGSSPIVALDKLNGIHKSAFHAGLFGFIIFYILCIIVYWPLAWKIRHGYYTDYPVSLPVQMKYLAWLNALGFLIFYAGFMIVLSDPNQIVYGVPVALKYLLVLPVFCTLMTITMIPVSIQIWRKQVASLWSRLYYTSATLVFILAIWQLHYWNLLGWIY